MIFIDFIFFSLCTKIIRYIQTLELRNYRVLGLVFGFSTKIQTQTQKPKKSNTQTQTQNTKNVGFQNPKIQIFLGLEIF